MSRKVIAIVVSLALHASLLVAMITYDLFSTYRSVGELKIGDFGGQASVRLINPADYGLGRKPGIAAPPRRPASLDEIKKRNRRDQEEQKSKAEEAKVEEKRESAESSETEREPEQAPASAEQPKFGRIDTGPIKQHLASLWEAHEMGTLDVPATFRITVSCKVNDDGSFSDIRIVESSGSRELDRTALAILTEISEQKAFAPLSLLSSVSVRLEVGPQSAGFSLVGFAPNAAVASDMADKYKTLLSAARLFVSDSRTRELLTGASVQNELSRVRASITLPRARAAEMIRASLR